MRLQSVCSWSLSPLIPDLPIVFKSRTACIISFHGVWLLSYPSLLSRLGRLRFPKKKNLKVKIRLFMDAMWMVVVVVLSTSTHIAK